MFQIILFLLLAMLGVWAFYNNMPLVGLFWAVFLVVVYWIINTEKFKIWAIRGAVFGLLIDFIFLFVLHRLNPQEDIAGIVIISLLLSGLVFGFVGYLIQRYLRGFK